MSVYSTRTYREPEMPSYGGGGGGGGSQAPAPRATPAQLVEWPARRTDSDRGSMSMSVRVFGFVRVV